MPSLTIFLDASVILSGLASPTGGSGKVNVRQISQELLERVTEENISFLQNCGLAMESDHAPLSYQESLAKPDPASPDVLT